MMYKITESNFEDTDSIMALIRINYNEKSFEGVIEYSNKLPNIEEDSIIGHRFLYRAHINLDTLNCSSTSNAIVNLDENDVEALVIAIKIQNESTSQAKKVLER